MKALSGPIVAIALLILSTPGSAEEAKPDKTKPYAAIDQHALDAPAKAEASLDKLARYLRKSGKTDEEKARAFYRWITDRISYDVAAFRSRRHGDQSAEAVLRKRKAVCTGYANLFVDLCTRSGLKAGKISGYSKGFGYTPGQKVVNGEKHAWNVVRIKGKWKFIESTWGAGAVNNGQFVKRFSEFYWCTPPERLIYTHFPLDRSWQLLKKPITVQQFEKQVKVDKGLFEMGVPDALLRSTLAGKSFRGLAKVYTAPFALTIVNVPLDNYLKDGQEYQFEIKSDDCVSMAVFNNRKPIHLTKDGNVFRGTVRAEKGQLQIAGRITDKEPRYHFALGYAVE
jgi:hypothetical protein